MRRPKLLLPHTLLWLPILLVSIVAIACESESTSGAALPRTTEVASQPTKAAAPQPTATAPRQAIEHEFSGVGSKVLGPIEIVEGVLTLAATHGGTSNFVVRVVGSDAEELSVNEIGRYSGAIAHPVSSGNLFGLAPGQVRIQIEADGSWSLRTNKTSRPRVSLLQQNTKARRLT